MDRLAQRLNVLQLTLLAPVDESQSIHCFVLFGGKQGTQQFGTRSLSAEEKLWFVQCLQDIESLDEEEVQNVRRKDPDMVVQVPQASFGGTTYCAVRIVFER